MRKILLSLWAIALLLLISINPANGQANFQPGQFGINAGLSYGLDLEEPGLRAGFTYFLGESTRLGADLTYWIIEDKWVMEEELSSTGMEINANLHFLFHKGRNLIFYAIGAGGLHYASVSGDLPELDTSDSEFGFGLGPGAEFNMGFISIFAEGKVFFSGFDQIKLNGGVRLYL